MDEMNSDFYFSQLPLYFISSFGIVSHVLLLIAFIKDPLKCFRNSATYLVANLACSDLIICFCGLFVAQPFTRRLYWIFFIIWRSTVPISIFTIFGIAVDRFLMVAFPFKQRSLMSGKKIVVWITLFWMLPLCYTLREFLSPESSEAFEVGNVKIYAELTLTFLAGALYVMTTRSLRIQARKLVSYNPEFRSNRTQTIRALKERRFMNTIAMVACITFIGIVPCIITYNVIKEEGIGGRGSVIHVLFRFSLIFFYCTFAVNPLMYFLRLTNYRKTFFAMYWRRKAH